MRLENNLYKQLDKVSTEDDKTIFHVALQKCSEIYKGHFPGHPITPGAAIVQIAEELIDKKIVRLSNIKFLIPIIPEEETKLEFSFIIKEKQEDTLKYEVIVSSANTTFAKLNIIANND